MSEKVAAQTLLTQLETAVHRLVESFWEEPYRFFTEADAVAALHTWVARRPELAQVYHTADGFETSLLHREYPTFFRFIGSDPSERLTHGGDRGHYDLALINPSYVRRYRAETVTNRNVRDRGDLSSPPLLATVEFKLTVGAWDERRVDGIRRVLGKLGLALESVPKSAPDTAAAYLCLFHRDVSSQPNRWDERWPTVRKMLEDAQEIRSVLAVCWPKRERQPFVYYGGPWITTGQSYM